VIQHVLQFGENFLKEQVVDEVSRDVYELCTQKFSSNVVQECLKRCNSTLRGKLISAFTNLSTHKLCDLMKHM